MLTIHTLYDVKIKLHIPKITTQYHWNRLSFYDIIINSIEKTSGPIEEYFLQSKKTLNAERSNSNIFFYLFVKALNTTEN